MPARNPSHTTTRATAEPSEVLLGEPKVLQPSEGSLMDPVKCRLDGRDPALVGSQRTVCRPKPNFFEAILCVSSHFHIHEFSYLSTYLSV